MKVPALGEASLDLPWLSPCGASLVALARAPAEAWSIVRSDPGAVLLVIRHASAALVVPGLSFFPALLHDPAVCEGAVRELERPAVGFVDWSQPGVRAIYQLTLGYARLASQVAASSGRADTGNAWVAGLLAPLGWLVACATDSTAAAACFQHGDFSRHPATLQQQLWGMDQAAIARRIARRWRLPPWLAASAGHLGLPAPVAQGLGVDRDLFQVIQLAVGLLQRQRTGLGLAVGATPEELGTALGLTSGGLAALEREADEITRSCAAKPEPHTENDPSQPVAWESPDSVPLLCDLLRLAGENRRLRDVSGRQRLENDVDDLHRALEQQGANAADRLREQKLSALAELAAGAGHEINNPLAVISGQAQYLLGHEPEPARQKALQTIIKQAERVHQILRELMQFARPPRPQKQTIHLPELIREVAASLGELAEHRQVRLLLPEAPAALLHADPGQVRTALACLLRNAIEAAPTHGWAALRVEAAGTGQVDLVIEDSGSGPDPSQREHLFDPFYSGRHAGRGRGLGLPTAWQLARQQGGDVRLASPCGGPTRFVLTLPTVPEPPPGAGGYDLLTSHEPFFPTVVGQP